MEESLGATRRAEELRSYRMQSITDVVLPANFGIFLGQEPSDSPLKAVVATVRLPTCLSTKWSQVLLTTSLYECS